MNAITCVSTRPTGQAPDKWRTRSTKTKAKMQWRKGLRLKTLFLCPVVHILLGEPAFLHLAKYGS